MGLIDVFSPAFAMCSYFYIDEIMTLLRETRKSERERETRVIIAF